MTIAVDIRKGDRTKPNAVERRVRYFGEMPSPVIDVQFRNWLS